MSNLSVEKLSLHTEGFDYTYPWKTPEKYSHIHTAFRQTHPPIDTVPLEHRQFSHAVTE